MTKNQLTISNLNIYYI